MCHWHNAHDTCSRNRRQKPTPVFWHRFLAPVSGACVMRIRSELSLGHFGTNADLSGQFRPTRLVPKCPGSEVSWVRSVRNSLYLRKANISTCAGSPTSDDRTTGLDRAKWTPPIVLLTKQLITTAINSLPRVEIRCLALPVTLCRFNDSIGLFDFLFFLRITYKVHKTSSLRSLEYI